MIRTAFFFIPAIVVMCALLITSNSALMQTKSRTFSFQKSRTVSQSQSQSQEEKSLSRSQSLSQEERSLSRSQSLSQEGPSRSDSQEQTATASRSCVWAPRFSLYDGLGSGMTFAACTAICQERGAFLATLRTQKEQNAAAIAVLGISAPFLIGGNSLVGGSAYAWQAGPAAGTTFYSSILPGGACMQESCSFASGQPANSLGENVLTISADGLWRSAVDGTAAGCLCERWKNVCPQSSSTSLSKRSISSMRTQSPSGGEGSTSSTHSVSSVRSRSSTRSKTFSEKGRQKIYFGFWLPVVAGNLTAQEMVDDRNNRCMTDVNGTLATIMSPQEQFYVAGSLINSSAKYMTAGNRLYDGVNFRWMYGPHAYLIIFTNITLATGTCVTYCPWKNGEPNNSNNQNETLLSVQITGWNDDIATRQNGYVCEKYVDHFNQNTLTFTPSHFTPTLSVSKLTISATPSLSPATLSSTRSSGSQTASAFSSTVIMSLTLSMSAVRTASATLPPSLSLEVLPSDTLTPSTTMAQISRTSTATRGLTTSAVPTQGSRTYSMEKASGTISGTPASQSIDGSVTTSCTPSPSPFSWTRTAWRTSSNTRTKSLSSSVTTTLGFTVLINAANISNTSSLFGEMTIASESKRSLSPQYAFSRSFSVTRTRTSPVTSTNSVSPSDSSFGTMTVVHSFSTSAGKSTTADVETSDTVTSNFFSPSPVSSARTPAATSSNILSPSGSSVGKNSKTDAESTSLSAEMTTHSVTTSVSSTPSQRIPVVVVTATRTLGAQLPPAPPLPTAPPGTQAPAIMIPGVPVLPPKPKLPNILLRVPGLSGYRVVIPNRDARSNVSFLLRVVASSVPTERIRVSMYYQQALTGSAFDSARIETVDGIGVDSRRDQTSAAAAAASCSSLQDVDFASSGCFSLAACANDTALLLPQGSITPVRITLGRAAFSNLLCESSSLSLVTSFVIASSVAAEMASGPQYFWMELLSNVTSAAVVAQARDAGTVWNVTLREGRSPPVQQQLAQLPRSDEASGSSNTSTHALQPNSTRTSALCIIRDVMSFKARVVLDSTESFTASGLYTVDCSPGASSATPSYPEALQLTCLGNPLCAGYITSSSFATDTEVGICYLLFLGSAAGGGRSSVTADPSTALPRRIVYSKASQAQRTCEALVAGGPFGAMVKIFVQQTYLASASKIEVAAADGKGQSSRLAVCGGTDGRFDGGIYGSSSQCGLYLLCTKYYVSNGSTRQLSAVADASMAQGGCDNAVGILFLVDYYLSATDASAAAPPPTPSPPSLFISSQEEAAFTLATAMSLSENAVASFYATNIARVLLSVQQTGFQCSSSQSTSRVPCPSALVSVATIQTTSGGDDLSVIGTPVESGPVSSCGGLTPFIFGSQGESGACSTSLYCSNPVLLSNASQQLHVATSLQPSTYLSINSGNFTRVAGDIGSAQLMPTTTIVDEMWSGWIRVRADVTTISRLRGASSGSCSAVGVFSALLLASSCLEATCSSSSLSTPPSLLSGFPLRRSQAAAQFQTLLLPLRGTSISSTRALFFRGRSLPSLQLLPGLGNSFPTDSRRDALLATVWTENVSSSLRPNVTLGCVADWFDQSQGSCEIPVPLEANYFVLSIAQTNMLKSVIATTFVSRDGSVQATRRCGGSSGFGGLPSKSGQCRTFLNCSLGYLASFGANISSIRIEFPQSVAFGDFCPQGFAAMVTFYQFVAAESRAPLVLNSTMLAAYKGLAMACSATNNLVTGSQICDGIVDCPDGSDEASCGAWYRVEHSAVFVMYKVAGTFAVNNSVADCRTLAVARQSVAFALSANRSHCVVYEPQLAQLYVSNPVQYLVSMPGYNLYVLLPDGPQSYSRCSAPLTCSGNGALAATAPGAICQCDCFPKFAGSDCSDVADMKYVGSTVVLLRSGSGLSSADIEYAITSLASAAITVTCAASEPYTRELVAVRCTVDGEPAALNGYYASAVERRVLARMNSALSLTSPLIENIILSTPPVLAGLFSCNVSADWLSGSCQLRNASAVSAVILAVTASTLINQLQVRIAFSSSSSGGASSLAREKFTSQSAAARIGSYACQVGLNAVATQDSSGCTVTVCKLTHLDSQNIATLTYSIDPGMISADDPCFQPVTVAAAYDLNITEIDPVLQVRNTTLDYSSFVIGGAVVVFIALVLALKGAVMAYWDWRDSTAACGIMKSEEEHTPSASSSKHLVLRLIALLLRRMDYYTSKPRLIRTERWSVGSAVIAFNIAVAGTFLMLFFYSSGGYSSNAEVMIQFHRDGNCGNSSFAPLPIRVAYVAAETARLCLQRPFGGVPVDGSGLFLQGYCENGGDGEGAVAHVKIGLSLNDCTSKPLAVVRSGQCVPSFSLNPTLNDTSYISVICGTVASVRTRFAQLLSLSLPPEEVDRDTAESRSVDPAWLPTQRLAAGGGTLYQYPRLRNKRVLVATSRQPSVFEYAANGALVAGPIAPQRFVLQDEAVLQTDAARADASEFYIESVASLELAAFESLENMSRASLSTSSASAFFPTEVASATPLDQDFPQGFVYSGFNSTDPNELWRDSVGAEAARYYSLVNSPADLGAFLSTVAEGQGLTITLYLRATLGTRGFAFALVDGREDLSSGTSPLLERLLSILESGGIANSNWNPSPYVFHGCLYLDGPSLAIRFIYSSSSSGALQELVWDLDALHLTRVFNGAWHHVALILRLENGPKGQIVVDGDTSLSKPGWNQCFESGGFMPPIQSPPSTSTTTAASYPVTNELTERVSAGGMLFTGYMNGGIARLQFTQQSVDLFDLWKTSTHAIMAVQAPPIVNFWILAMCMICCAGIFFLVLLAPLLVALFGGASVARARRREKKEKKAACEALQEIWEKMPSGPHSSSTSSAASRPYEKLSYPKLKEMLSLSSDEDTKTLLRELQLSYDEYAALHLVRICFHSSQGSMTNPDERDRFPTASEWSCVLRGQKRSPLSLLARSSTSLGTGSQEEESAPVTVRGRVAAGSNTPHDLVMPPGFEWSSRGSRSSIDTQTGGLQTIGSSAPINQQHANIAVKVMEHVQSAVTEIPQWFDDISLESVAAASPNDDDGIGIEDPVQAVDFFTGEICLDEIATVSETDAEAAAMAFYSDIDLFPDFGNAEQVAVVGSPSSSIWKHDASSSSPGFLVGQDNNNPSSLELGPRRADSVASPHQVSFCMLPPQVAADLASEPDPSATTQWQVDDYFSSLPHALSDGSSPMSPMDSPILIGRRRSSRHAWTEEEASSPQQQQQQTRLSDSVEDGHVMSSSPPAWSPPREERSPRAKEPSPQRREEPRAGAVASMPAAGHDDAPEENTHQEQRAGAGRSSKETAEERRRRQQEERGDGEDEGDDGGDDDSNDQNSATGALLAPIIWVLQSVYVYMSTMNLPGNYTSTFKPAFSLISLDLRLVTASIPPTILLLLQLICGLLSLSALFYLLRNDEIIFGCYVGRYFTRFLEAQELERPCDGDGDEGKVSVREADKASSVEVVTKFSPDDEEVEEATQVDREGGKCNGKSKSITTQLRDLTGPVENLFGKIIDFPLAFMVHVLPLPQAQKLDRFLGRASGPFSCSDRASLESIVRLDEHHSYRIERANADANVDSMTVSELSHPDRPAAAVAPEDGVAITPAEVLDGVRNRCIYHTSRILSLQRQTELWPFRNRPSCCIVTNGIRCGRSIGIMFRCGYEETAEEYGGPEGSRTQCEYALCEQHFRGSLFDRLLAIALAFPLRARDAGAFSILASLFLSLSNIIYTPIVKTSIMILACHPSYQCEFGTCWTNMTQSYTLTAYLCFTIIFFLGMGLPVVLTLLLRRRQILLTSVFFSDSSPMQKTAANLPEGNNNNNMDEDGNSVASSRSKNKAAEEEYEKFAATDTTALANLYQAFRFNWIFIAPILLLWKVILLVPPIFLETNSFSQLVGEAIAETSFAVFMFAVAPSKSMAVNSMMRLGCVHQQAFLGLIALDKYNRLHSKADMSLPLIVITIAYLLISVAVCVLVQVVPAVSRVTRTMRAKQMLRKRGVQYSNATSLYAFRSTTIAAEKV